MRGTYLACTSTPGPQSLVSVDAIGMGQPSRRTHLKRAPLGLASPGTAPQSNVSVVEKPHGRVMRKKDQARQHFQYQYHFLSEASRPSEGSARGERSAWSLLSRETPLKLLSLKCRKSRVR